MSSVTSWLLWGSLVILQAGDAPLFQAKPLTVEGEFTPGIEGPATDGSGAIFAANFARQGTIGRVTPTGKGEVYVELPNGSVGNGIRFDRQGHMFVAVYVTEVEHTRLVEFQVDRPGLEWQRAQNAKPK